MKILNYILLLLKEKVHVVTLERVGCEVDVQFFNLVAIDSCITLKIVVVGIECEQFGAIFCPDVSYAHDSLADVVLHCDLTALGSAPHNLHTGALAIKRICGYHIDKLIAFQVHLPALYEQETIAL